MENEKPNLVQHALKFGLIMGLFNIVLQLGIYIVKKELLVSFWVAFAAIVVTIVLAIYPIRNFRSQQGGSITFKDAFLIGFIVFAGSGLLTNVFQYLLYNFIDPQLPDFIKEKAIEKTVGLMERFGAGQEEIAKAIEPLEKEDFKQTPAKLGTSFLGNVMMGAFLSLLIALFTRKNPKNHNIE
jgi:hypothetical protein